LPAFLQFLSLSSSVSQILFHPFLLPAFLQFLSLSSSVFLIFSAFPFASLFEIPQHFLFCFS
jgi:hypothetical protein